MSSSQQKPTPSIALWDLLVTGEEPSLSSMRPNLKPAVRKELEEEGLIELEKRGRSTHVIATDDAWSRAFDDLVVEGSKSAYAATALQHVLNKINHFLSVNDISLAEFLRPEENASPKDLKDKIREAYTKASQGRYNVRVRLTELRTNLDDFPQDEVDRVLGEMELAEDLVLMPLDDPQDIKDEDEAAAVNVGGQKRHIVYMKG